MKFKKTRMFLWRQHQRELRLFHQILVFLHIGLYVASSYADKVYSVFKSIPDPVYTTLISNGLSLKNVIGAVSLANFFLGSQLQAENPDLAIAVQAIAGLSVYIGGISFYIKNAKDGLARFRKAATITAGTRIKIGAFSAAYAFSTAAPLILAGVPGASSEINVLLAIYVATSSFFAGCANVTEALELLPKQLSYFKLNPKDTGPDKLKVAHKEIHLAIAGLTLTILGASSNFLAGPAPFFDSLSSHGPIPLRVLLASVGLIVIGLPASVVPAGMNGSALTDLKVCIVRKHLRTTNGEKLSVEGERLYCVGQGKEEKDLLNMLTPKMVLEYFQKNFSGILIGSITSALPSAWFSLLSTLAVFSSWGKNFAGAPEVPPSAIFGESTSYENALIILSIVFVFIPNLLVQIALKGGYT